VAEPLSARNKIPAGPNVIGPADCRSADPGRSPYSLIATSPHISGRTFPADGHLL
jgi:hypothetical protein